METFMASTLNYLSQSGFIWVAGVKVLGYLAFLALGPLRGRSFGVIALGAGLRFLLGIAGGLALLAFGQGFHPNIAIVLGVLGVVRFAEWRLLFTLLGGTMTGRNQTRDSAMGTGVSFLLDLPAALGWFGIQGGPF